MSSQKNVNEIFMHYRECVRHLWNTYYRNLEDGWHSFINVEREIFETLVLEQLFPDNNYSNKDIIVLPQSAEDEFEVLWNDKTNKEQCTYSSIKIVPSKIDLIFIDFFDWNEYGYRDYQYIQCKIANYEADPQLINTELLIEVENVVIVLKNQI